MPHKTGKNSIHQKDSSNAPCIVPLKNLWTFVADEKEIIAWILEHGVEHIFSWINLWVLKSFGDNQKQNGKTLQSIQENFSVYTDNTDRLLYSYEVSKKITGTVNAVCSILDNQQISWTPIFRKDVLPKLRESLYYQLYIYWVIELLKFNKQLNRDNIELTKLKDIPDNLAQEISNILQDSSLTTLFIVLKAQGIINFSPNAINDYEEEKEIKILDVNKKSLVQKLEELKLDKKLKLEKVFDWVVEDVYYDYPWLWLDRNGKRSLRIRNKKKLTQNNDEYFYIWNEKLDDNIINMELPEENFYTIKRKKPEVVSGKSREENKIKDKSRTCYEKELEILNFPSFEKSLTDYWLYKTRKKKKTRVSYKFKLKWKIVKIDIDQYEEIPLLVEIEAESDELIAEVKKLLWLENNKTLNTGSRWLYEHYWKKEKYIKYYKAIEEKKRWKQVLKEVHWKKQWLKVIVNQDKRAYKETPCTIEPLSKAA